MQSHVIKLKLQALVLLMRAWM